MSISSSEKTAHRFYVFAFVAVALAGALVLGGTNYIVDPLQRFRPAWFYPPHFSEQQRLQAPALARSYPYDTVVLGSSTAENFLIGDLRSILGVNAIRLPLSGSGLHEQALLVDVALRTKRLKRVIWFIDSFAFTTRAHAVRTDFGPFPFYMYEDGPDAAAKYLLSLDMFKTSIGIVYDWLTAAAAPPQNLENLNTWYQSKSFGGNAVDNAYNDRRLKQAIGDLIGPRLTKSRDEIAATIRVNLFDVISTHSNVSFDLVLIPSTIAYWARLREVDAEYFEANLWGREQVGHLSHLPNVKIHDFMAADEYTHDFERFTDLMHFDLRTNRNILRDIEKGRYLRREIDNRSIRTGVTEFEGSRAK